MLIKYYYLAFWYEMQYIRESLFYFYFFFLHVGSLGNPTSSPDMPSTNSKQQNIPWQQNSYLMDSDIQAGVSTYVSNSLFEIK